MVTVRLRQVKFRCHLLCIDVSRDDILCIFFAHMKNDQGGQRKRDPRHIYSNSLEPIICPVLALAIYFSVFNISGTKDSCLFPDDNQYKRFSKYLERILLENKGEILYVVLILRM
jgi:hypothetical protein